MAGTLPDTGVSAPGTAPSGRPDVAGFPRRQQICTLVIVLNDTR
jgi:hypothetical protein